MSVLGGSERADDDRGGDGTICTDVQQVARVVIKPRDDLDVACVSEPDVGEV